MVKGKMFTYPNLTPNFRMEELRQYYRFRPDEIFRRVTVSSLVGLMIEVSKLEYQVRIPALSL